MSVNKSKKIIDYNGIIIFCSSLVLVVRYMGAFISSDIVKIPEWLSNILTIGIGISGAGMGVLDGLGGAILFQGWRNALPARDKKWSFKFIMLTVFVFLVILNGMIVMLPFTVMRTAGISMIDVLGSNHSGMLWLWSIAVNIAPYFIIGGTMLSNSVTFDLERTKSQVTEQVEPLRNDKTPNNNVEKNEQEQDKNDSNSNNNQGNIKKWDWRNESIGFSETTLIAIAKTKPGQLGILYKGMDFQLERIWRRRAKEALINKHGYTIEKFKEIGIKVTKGNGNINEN